MALRVQPGGHWMRQQRKGSRLRGRPSFSKGGTRGSPSDGTDRARITSAKRPSLSRRHKGPSDARVRATVSSEVDASFMLQKTGSRIPVTISVWAYFCLPLRSALCHATYKCAGKKRLVLSCPKNGDVPKSPLPCSGSCCPIGWLVQLKKIDADGCDCICISAHLAAASLSFANYRNIQ
jgi:hypothetical protein